MQGPNSWADNTVPRPHTTKKARPTWASYIQQFPLPTLARRTPNKADGEYRKAEGVRLT